MGSHIERGLPDPRAQPHVADDRGFHRHAGTHGVERLGDDRGGVRRRRQQGRGRDSGDRNPGVPPAEQRPDHEETAPHRESELGADHRGGIESPGEKQAARKGESPRHDSTGQEAGHPMRTRGRI